MSGYICHHGVKGQQWGVKHGPPYPVDPDKGVIHIKKGTKIKRLSGHDEAGAKGHAYVNYNKKDIDRYNGFFAGRLKGMSMGAPVYEHTMEATKDLVAPSKRERIDEFIELYSTDKQVQANLAKYYKKELTGKDKLEGFKDIIDKDISKIDRKELEEKGYPLFARALGSQCGYIRDAYFKRLAQKGYNMITDDCDASRFGREPAIIFDREDTLSYKGKRELGIDEIQDSWTRNGTRYNNGNSYVSRGDRLAAFGVGKLDARYRRKHRNRT